MGDPGRQRADGLHLLSFPEMLLKLQFFGDVMFDGDIVTDRPGSVAHR